MTVAGSSSAAWFPEPSLADDTYANRGELVTDWRKISTTFEDFDHALYGRETSVLGTEAPTGVLDVSGSEFHRDGVYHKGEGDPTWAAVLAFVNVYLGGGADPVLYLHPRFQGDLPETLTSSERRSFDPVAGSVNMVPSCRPGFMKGLSFVSV